MEKPRKKDRKAATFAYIDRNSPIHALTGTTKFFLLIVWAICIMISFDTRLLVGMIIFGIILISISKIRFSEIKSILRVLIVFMLLNNIGVFIFAPEYGVGLYESKTIIAQLPFFNIDLTQQQLFYMLNLSLKYFVMVPIVVVFMFTTNPSEFASSLYSIGVSYKIAYSVSLALRYIPDIQDDYQSISQAQEARGIALSKKEKTFTRLKNSTVILMPLILSSLDRIEVIANAMELRGFGKHKTRTWYRKRKFQKMDFVMIGIVVLIMLTAIALLIVNGGRFYNPFIK